MHAVSGLTYFSMSLICCNGFWIEKNLLKLCKCFLTCIYNNIFIIFLNCSLYLPMVTEFVYFMYRNMMFIQCFVCFEQILCLLTLYYLCAYCTQNQQLFSWWLQVNSITVEEIFSNYKCYFELAILCVGWRKKKKKHLKKAVWKKQLISVNFCLYCLAREM